MKITLGTIQTEEGQYVPLHWEWEGLNHLVIATDDHELHRIHFEANELIALGDAIKSIKTEFFKEQKHDEDIRKLRN